MQFCDLLFSSPNVIRCYLKCFYTSYFLVGIPWSVLSLSQFFTQSNRNLLYFMFLIMILFISSYILQDVMLLACWSKLTRPSLWNQGKHNNYMPILEVYRNLIAYAFAGQPVKRVFWGQLILYFFFTKWFFLLRVLTPYVQLGESLIL